jgi:hypothetical protein
MNFDLNDEESQLVLECLTKVSIVESYKGLDTTKLINLITKFIKLLEHANKKHIIETIYEIKNKNS